MEPIKFARAMINSDSFSDIVDAYEEKDKVIEAIQTLADILKNADRLGTDKDEPEGSRYIRVSDTLANYMVLQLEEYLRFKVT